MRVGGWLKPRPRRNPGIYCKVGWVGPRAGLDECGKSRPKPGFDRRIVRPVASRYPTMLSRPTSVNNADRNWKQVAHDHVKWRNFVLGMFDLRIP